MCAQGNWGENRLNFIPVGWSQPIPLHESFGKLPSTWQQAEGEADGQQVDGGPPPRDREMIEGSLQQMATSAVRMTVVTCWCWLWVAIHYIVMRFCGACCGADDDTGLSQPQVPGRGTEGPQ